MILLTLVLSAWLQAPAAARAPAERARLVVMVSVDQMVPEQLERLAPLLGDGLGRFVREGRQYKSSALVYGATETGPGHATYATGCNPRKHGIVGNAWVPAEATREEYCVRDAAALVVTADGPQAGEAYERGRMSPKNMRRPALGDLVKTAVPGARVVSISAKDRSAVAMGGERPDAALWWDRVAGGFVTSTYYSERLPAWVVAWNADWVERTRTGDFARGWEALALDADALEQSGTAADDRAGERPWNGKRTLPHAVPPVASPPEEGQLARAAAAVYGGPLADLFVVELAQRAVTELELGADPATDVLMLSLSACDTVGHSFGPTSREVTDTLLRADRALAALFAELDAKVGRGRWIAALSADHGVLDLPEALLERGIGAVRVPAARVKAAHDAMRAALKQAYGQDFWLAADDASVRLSETGMRAAGLDPASVRRAAAAALEQAGADWIETVIPADDLASSEPPAGGWLVPWWHCHDPERSPDVRVQQRPWHLLSEPNATGTTHGSPYEYDRRVPLVFLGPAFTRGASFAPASPCDAVPTLLAALGLPVPADLDGRQLP